MVKTGSFIWQTVVIALSENHQWTLQVVAESVMGNEIQRPPSLNLSPHNVHINYKGKDSNFIMEKLSRCYGLNHIFSPQICRLKS